MTNVLFSFTRSVQNAEGKMGPPQPNYINPYQVISSYWETRTTSGGDEKKVLVVFTLTYTFILPEITGKNFMIHWENALRLSLNGMPMMEPQKAERPTRRERPVMEAQVIEDDLIQPNWSDPVV